MPKSDNYVYELKIPGYPRGSNITIMNTYYVPPLPDPYEDNKFLPDYISILFRDNNTGEKHVHIIQRPKRTWYKLKDEYNVDHHLFFIEADKVEPVTCNNRSILKSIAKNIGAENFYDDMMQQGRKNDLKQALLSDYRVFMADMDIQNYYRFLFDIEYTNEVFKLNKAYLDIETDGKEAISDFPMPGEVPINAVSYLDEKNNISYQFLLENYQNPLMLQYEAEFSNNHDAQYNKLKNFIIDAVGGPKKAKKFGIDKLEYRLIFFSDELEMLKTIFDIINESSPDVLMIWNMAFDLDYIIARIAHLGADPVDVITDKRISPRYLRFYIDERNKNVYAERGDYVSMSSYTIWLDQMIQFASRRKGRGMYPSFRLDAIGEAIAEVNKLDYSHITNNINMLPYLNYEVFSFYNIMDTIVQMCIENVTQDSEYIFTKCLTNNTIYPKGHRQSVYLANRFTKEFYHDGYIMGNNLNIWNEQPTSKFPGAMVGDPFHNSEDSMMKINGRPSMIAENMVDFDYSALYPSIIMENNLAMNTQVGKIDIENKIHDNEHPDMYTSDDDAARYSRSGEFLDNLMSGNILEFCRRWLSLGDIHDVLKDIEEYYKYNGYRGRPMNLTEAIYFTTSKELMGAIELVNDEYHYDNLLPAVTFDEHIDESKALDIEDEIKKGAIL